ncbi:hypothetical protein THRCLA_20585 [Thraustotheca clavata]|uniref:Uncharacterized protein n=1 Tax=Thraustotheca clavata TaxID=74557 RepID=A0A1W0A5H5_9STRA|nr:hypothetical protein THRCLA_20585 [Thraustotheca clavata]
MTSSVTKSESFTINGPEREKEVLSMKFEALCRILSNLTAGAHVLLSLLTLVILFTQVRKSLKFCNQTIISGMFGRRVISDNAQSPDYFWSAYQK